MFLKSGTILVSFCFIFVYGIECPKEFLQLGQKCYSIHDTPWRNWFQAITYCLKLGDAKLLTIENEEELKLLSDHLSGLNFKNEHSSNASHYFWTAGTNLGSKNSKYYWQTTGQDMTYKIWAEDEPNNNKNKENCAELWPRGGKYELNDAPCWQHNMFICQREGV